MSKSEGLSAPLAVGILLLFVFYLGVLLLFGVTISGLIAHHLFGFRALLESG